MISPCIKLCVIDPELQRCTGCNRTLEQIKLWTAYTDQERNEIIEGLIAQLVRAADS